MTGFRLPWDDLAPPVVRSAKPAMAAARKPPRIDPAPATGIVWQCWHLVVHGAAEQVASFAAAARGPGLIPWRADDGGFEDWVVGFAFGGSERPSLSMADCRTLARQFREAVEARHARNERQPGRRTQCPLDLHALLPVPAALLPLGPAHPDAGAWLRRHWGVADQPRHAAVLEDRTAGRRLPRGHVPLVLGFYTEGPAPEPARLALQRRWPTLVFRVDCRPMT